MAREQQMMDSAMLAETNSRTIDLSKKKVFLSAYIQGWKDADSHPNWISVKDELPKHDTDENGLVSFPIVLVCLYDGYRDTSYYDDIGEEWGDYDGEVEYWMPMPPAPGKEVSNE